MRQPPFRSLLSAADRVRIGDPLGSESRTVLGGSTVRWEVDEANVVPAPGNHDAAAHAAASAASDVAAGQWHDRNHLLETPLEGVGSRITPYELLQQIVEGGMGVVFKAEQQEPVRRMVGLKVINTGYGFGAGHRAFQGGPAIVGTDGAFQHRQGLDANETPSGQPYFVMELAKGNAITHYCDELRLSPRQRLELFVPVCQAFSTPMKMASFTETSSR